MEKKQIEGKIFDLQEKLEICEIALDINEDEELEPAWKDIIKAHKEHIADLEEFLKSFAIPIVSKAKRTFCNNCQSGLVDYPEIGRRTCMCGALGYNVTE